MEYISKLLNRSVTDQTEVSLSSAQRARVYAWLTKNSIIFDDAILSRKFNIHSLLKTGSDNYLQRDGNSPATVPQKITISSGVGIGVDIQRVDELFPNGLSNDPKADTELIGIFTLHELSYAQSQVDPLQTLAGIFCIKEAVKKCSNTNLNFLDIKISHGVSGAPIVSGYGVSISHSGNYALAVAIPEPLKSEVAGRSLSSTSGASLKESSRDFLTPKYRTMDLILFLLIAISIFIGIFG
jgi:phosphopantetheinyl transferase (holo-ACP synthase)